MADHEFDIPWTPPKTEPPNHIKVAIIGAGPAGLTAALRLAQHGYSATVFERMPLPGGMLTYGIPAFRLPREALLAEIDYIWRAGVEFKPNMELGTDFTIQGLKDDGYKAIILTLGAHRSRLLDIKGEEKQGVYQGLQMLRDIATGNAARPGRQAHRHRRRRRYRHRHSPFVSAAGRRRGACPLPRPTRRHDRHARGSRCRRRRRRAVPLPRLAGRGAGRASVTAVRMQRQRLGDFDESGRRMPVPIPGTEFDMQCDIVIPAVGEMTTWVEDESLGLHSRATFEVGKAADINVPGVFAAGDAVLGPSTVVKAVAQGNLAAQAVETWLTTGELADTYVRPKNHDIAQLFDLEDYAKAHRPKPLKLTAEERKARGERFDERESAWDEHTIQEECKRCLRCDLDWLERTGQPLP